MRHFPPVCTLPETGPAFIGAPNVRSTLDIVWTCVTVLILCSWSVLHLTVPEQFAPQTRRQRFNLQAARLGSKVKWMLLTLIGPEFIFGRAAAAWNSARSNTPYLQQVAEDDGVPWSKTHTSFADIGGFVLRFRNDDDAVATETSDLTGDSCPTNGTEFEDLQASQPRRKDRLQSKRNQIRTQLETRTRLFGSSPWRPLRAHKSLTTEAIGIAARILVEEDETILMPEDETILMLEGDTWVLTAIQLYKARNFGIIPTLPHVTLEDLDDKNKGDVLVKLLAVVQVSWMVFQVIVRATMGRPSSPLEIMAMAFAGSTFLFYLISMDRPQNVNTPFYIDAQRPAHADEMAMIALAASSRDKVRVRNDATPYLEDRETFSSWAVFVIAAVVGSLVFGGLHLFAWNSPFPTDLEKWLWRASSLVTMLGPITTLVLARIIPEPGVMNLGFWASQVTLSTGFLALVIARLFITVEAFRSLYYLPPESYVNTWAANIPHFG